MRLVCVQEVMLHRRTEQDDRRGMDQPLNDTTHVQTAFRLMLETPVLSEVLRRRLAVAFEYPAVPFFEVRGNC